MKVLKFLFSIHKENDYCKVVTIFGIRRRFKNQRRYLHFRLSTLHKRLDFVDNCLNQIRMSIPHGLELPHFEHTPKHGSVEDLQEHKENVEKLFQNLSPEAEARLGQILYRCKKVVGGGGVDAIYTSDELTLLHHISDEFKTVKKIGNYYQYKHYKLPFDFFSESVFFHKHGLELVGEISDGVIIDAGAFICDSALIFRERYPNHPIISFEPVSENYEMCQETIKLNNLKDVKVEKCALGDSSSDVVITTSNLGSKINDIQSARDSLGSETIKQCTLDDYVAKNNLRVALIKTDVEGYEPNLLRGAYQTIKSQRPVLLISIYHNYHDFYKIKPMIESWGLDYEFDFFKGIDGKSVHYEIMLICKPRVK